MKLILIKDYIEEIIENYANLFEITISVFDDNKCKICSVGRNKDKISDVVDGNSVFGHAIDLGNPLYVENPGKYELCQDCDRKYDCKEEVSFSTPIKYGSKVIGIISVTAFSEKEKKFIIRKIESLKLFNDLMGKLFVEKLYSLNEFAIDKSHIMEDIFYNLNTGVIITKKSGEIVKVNPAAYEKLSLNTDCLNSNIKDFINNIDLIKINECNTKVQGAFENGSIRIIYTVFKLKNGTEEVTVFFIDDMKSYLTNEMPLCLINSFDDIIGSSKSINYTKKIAFKATKSESNVLISGESGTGKELFARAIHYSGSRKKGPFIPVNCAAIPDNLLESELFGYEEGAFTGAKKTGKKGKFQQAQNGTIFLDEIGEMKLSLQVKLLRVLQDGFIEKVGGEKFIYVDARIIAATNKNLEKLVEEGKFREDLFYRLNVIPIYVPALNDRDNDILIISDYLTKKLNLKMNRNIAGFSDEVKKMFQTYKWKGNIRELENVIEYSFNMDENDVIEADDLPEKFVYNATHHVNIGHKAIKTLRELELEEIEKAVEIHGNTKHGMQKAAKELEISVSTIYRRLKLI